MTQHGRPRQAAFPAVSIGDWLRDIQQSLGDSRAERVLCRTTFEGLRVPALSLPESAVSSLETDGHSRALLGVGPAEPELTARIRRGAMGPLLRTALDADCDDSIGAVADAGMHSVVVPVEMACPAETPNLEVALSAAPVAGAGHLRWWQWAAGSDDRRVALGVEPFQGVTGAAFAAGQAAAQMRTVAALLADAQGDAQDDASASRHRVVRLGAEEFHRAGAGQAQALGIGLATLVQWLRVAEEHGCSAQRAFSSAEWHLPCDPMALLEVAKFRAARRLAAEVAAACGAPGAHRDLRLVGSLSWRALAGVDVENNAVRDTVAAFASLVGGADVFETTPCDAVAGALDLEAHHERVRMARNAPLVLLHEAHLAWFDDAAHGSYAIESLTQSLEAAAWDYFTQMERAGGVDAAVSMGLIADWLQGARASQRAAVRTRELGLVGVSEFPLPGERAPDGATQRDAASAPREGLEPMRWAASFEAFRTRPVEQWPLAHIVSLGTLSEHDARVRFVQNALAAGGFRVSVPDEVDGGGGERSLSEHVRLFVESGATVAIVATSDALAHAHGPQLHAELVAAGARRVAIAGRPSAEAPVPAGVDHLYLGADLVALLERWHLDAGPLALGGGGR